jgi:glyoxylase-like metal-dependent hydrolase (beta-lactamase superfamily II)
LQVVRLWTDSGWLLLASDASHYAANMDEGRPFPIVIDIGDMVDGWSRLRTLVDDPARIIPGHDPVVMQQFPAPEPALQGIIVRLG